MQQVRLPPLQRMIFPAKNPESIAYNANVTETENSRFVHPDLMNSGYAYAAEYAEQKPFYNLSKSGGITPPDYFMSVKKIESKINHNINITTKRSVILLW